MQAQPGLVCAMCICGRQHSAGRAADQPVFVSPQRTTLGLTQPALYFLPESEAVHRQRNAAAAAQPLPRTSLFVPPSRQRNAAATAQPLLLTSLFVPPSRRRNAAAAARPLLLTSLFAPP